MSDDQPDTPPTDGGSQRDGEAFAGTAGGAERPDEECVAHYARDDNQPNENALSGKIRVFLAFIGSVTRHRVWFLLIMLGTIWGVLHESVRPNTWRRTVRYEFRTTLGEVAGGGLVATLVTGTLTGLGGVSQAIYWLGFAGMSKMTGPLLVTVIVREIAPILVGVLMLGRSGMLALTELGMLTTGGQVKSMQAEGVDPFLLLVLPRTLAFTVSGFTLGILFSVASLATGYVVSRASGAISNSIWSFFYDVVTAMTPADYILIPLKFIVVGFLVGLGCCVSGLTASSEDTVSTMLPRGFSRGMLIVMAVSVLFSLKL
ncbi:ABC transporter permease [Acetobacter nitrogenifigens DSM 23921 = NBRC 105050]|uniref:ABC transporter permease n=1 Tax=Acetobacter nitrogenifigens DSM 23921 = NBRC 105050 TaxID=1120919 RepID=A0A511XDB1_9PROT|nr:ABC transporter permease [Acetobacter nitrogenifigens]GBQ89948.1 ABC transporter permease [Acetobacter nitrogenifigens DSM 23921 = NBRC 105050]GEN60944.1 hypothetical protein ANI02nite_28280 [Acetobacter nitrogenifigens DSM 23921 = NBRC 105050]